MLNPVRRVATPNFGQKMSNFANKVKIKQMGALLVATGARISFFFELDKKWLSYGPKRDAQIWARAPNFAVFGP